MIKVIYIPIGTQAWTSGLMVKPFVWIAIKTGSNLAAGSCKYFVLKCSKKLVKVNNLPFTS